MKRFMFRLVPMLLAALLGGTPALAATCDNVTADEALKAEDARYAAQMSNDFATMDKLFSPDLVYTHTSAVVDNKQSYIESMRSGKVVYKVMRRSDVQVRTFGCIAILTGNGNYDVTVNDKDVNVLLRFHSIWQKKDGMMQYISWQSTRIP
jgi:hypothetical protein